MSGRTERGIGREDRVRVWSTIKDGNRDECGLEIIEDKIKTCRGSKNDGMRITRDRNVYFGIITAWMQESVTSHLPPSSPHFISLHPGSTVTYTPHVPSSLFFSPGPPFFSVSLFHHLFPLPLWLSLPFTSLHLYSPNTPLSSRPFQMPCFSKLFTHSKVFFGLFHL